MSREDLIAVATRLFAVFLLITVARFIPSAVALLDQNADGPSPVLAGLVLVSGLAACGVLWLFPLSIARKLLPAMREPRSETAMSGPVALAVGLTLLGMWLLASALPDAFYWASLFLLTRDMDPALEIWGHESTASVATTAVELALAVWLIFGSSGIRRLILRYRYGPTVDMS